MDLQVSFLKFWNKSEKRKGVKERNHSWFGKKKRRNHCSYLLVSGIIALFEVSKVNFVV